MVLTLGAVGTGTLWIGSHVCWVGEEEDEVYFVGSGDCLVGCRHLSYWLPLDFDRHLSLTFRSGVGSLYYSEEVAAYTSEEQRETELRFGLFYGLRAYVYHDDEYGEATNVVSVVLPMWLVFTLFAAYPTVAFIRGPLRRWRRRREGSCVKCGYDLTGNVTGVCPECGTEIVSR